MEGNILKKILGGSLTFLLLTEKNCQWNKTFFLRMQVHAVPAKHVLSLLQPIRDVVISDVYYLYIPSLFFSV